MPVDLSTLVASFNPAASRKEYTDYQKVWQLYLDLMELDQPKLQALVEKHHDDEDATKLALRKTLAAVFNLIPSVLDVVKLYLFAEEPVFDMQGDEALQAFIDDCDGAGTRWADYVRQRALPLSMAMGWIDVFVDIARDPLASPDILTQADATAAGVAPRIFTITPLQRLNWSVQGNGTYHGLTFTDAQADTPSLLTMDRGSVETCITIQAAGTVLPGEQSVWIRSTRSGGRSWQHASGFAPTKRVPVASLPYQWSVDPARPHWGVSKIATMAVLTKLMVQVLSWTEEDMLANLAILALPTRGGQIPKKEDGTAAISEFNVFSTIYYPSDSRHAPSIVQGSVDHIKVKLEFCQACIREILRLAHLSTVSGESGGMEKSGFHAVVNRSELFQELSDTARRLDTFTLDVLALVKSWTSGQDYGRRQLLETVKPQVSYYKGPYNTEPLADVIRTATAAINMFRGISETLAVNQYKEAARAIARQDDPDLPVILKEIDANTAAALAATSPDALLAESAAIQAGRMSGTATVTNQAPAAPAAGATTTGNPSKGA